MKNLIQTLIDTWLSLEEAQVYIVVLWKWQQTPTDIAKSSWLKRTSVNNYIWTLLKKWYLQRSVAWKRMKYIAESPESILKEIEEKKKQFIEHLPELNYMFLSASQKANVRYFEWKTGIREIYREISLGFLPIASFYSLDRYLDLFKTMDVMDEFIWNIRYNGNSIRDLMEDTKKSRNIMKYREANGKAWKYLPDTFNLTIDMMIQWDKVAIISFSSQMWIIIENKWIADFHKNVFDHFWWFLK